MAVCGEHCDNCTYIGEGDFYCMLTQKLVMEDFCPTEDFGNCNYDPNEWKREQTKERLNYAKKLLTENKIEFKICNESTAHIQATTDSGELLNFWARTGKIQGKEERGIKNFIKILKGEKNGS